MAKKATTKMIDGTLHSVHATRASKTLKPLEDVLCPLYDNLSDYVGKLGFSENDLLSLLRSSIVIRLQARTRSVASTNKMPKSYQYAKVAELIREDEERYTLGDGKFDYELMDKDVQACWENDNTSDDETVEPAEETEETVEE